MALSKERLMKEALARRQVLMKTQRIKHKIMVLSGKGGVGKSMVSANLAMAFASMGLRVSIFDIDVHGGSLPTYLGMKNMRLILKDGKIYPAEGPLGIKVVSSSFLLPKEDQPVIWRGPLKIKFIRDMLRDVEWGDQDIMVIDTPPGTGDELQGIVQNVNRIDGAIAVTTPSDLSIHVLARSIGFLKRMRVPALGIIENMSYVKCPNGDKINIFGESRAERVLGIPLLARIPMTIEFAEPSQNPFLKGNLDSENARIFLGVSDKILNKIKNR